MNEQKVATLYVTSKYLDDYPELLAAYERTLVAAFVDLYGEEPDWSTYERIDGQDEPLATIELKNRSILRVWGAK